eukprot:CAMPEP_0194514404 /NCGR_PEP_ID=MMETSP0253-20130528/46862_1 /TAXON_ID=2966 /ORGANISM="Noctiluca scintillans" /LENGTH=118 /DNA_ID=CAMNT_0039358059 /DNA_START=88 /DNA_END=446 /DNA_ORIENTATION=+
MDMSTEDSQLPSAAKRCADICTHKFTDTAMLVSAETQLWQMEAFRQQQSAALSPEPSGALEPCVVRWDLERTSSASDVSRAVCCERALKATSVSNDKNEGVDENEDGGSGSVAESDAG